MKETVFFDELLKSVFPYIKKNYDLAMLKKELQRVDRYRQRLSQRVKELEEDVKNER
jgi:hypothetical protein